MTAAGSQPDEQGTESQREDLVIVAEMILHIVYFIGVERQSRAGPTWTQSSLEALREDIVTQREYLEWPLSNR